MRKIKNLDKFIVGADAYDIYDGEWVVIKAVDADNKECEVDNGMAKLHKVKMDFLCPNVDGVRLKKDKNCCVCYNADGEIKEPYYSPNYNEYVGEDDITNEALEAKSCEMINSFVMYMTRLFEAKFNAKMGRNNFIADYIHSKFGEGAKALDDFMKALETKSMEDMLDDMVQNNLIEDSMDRLVTLAKSIDERDYTDLLRVYDALRSKNK